MTSPLGRTLMVQGTSSSAGKSLLVTALCRIYARRGLRVRPFKSQNMALNSAVTPDGLEIGRAQMAQAEAARATPSVDMNPILLKPEGASTSQVVLMGQSIGAMHFRDYHRRKPELRETIGACLDRLRGSADLVVIEGAGSPAEVNLRANDVVNMWVAHRAQAPVLLVSDIERGGALASIVGTLALLDEADRTRVQATVINKFRGDPALFHDGVSFLQERTGLPVAGVIPHLGDTGLASEDSLELRSRDKSGGARIAIAKLPHVSNFDEFEALSREPGLEVVWTESPEVLEGAALAILPGTKCTVKDLRFVRERGLAAAIARRAAKGLPVLGICGGYQMLGERILDPSGVESDEPDVPGLNLLPVVTRFDRVKETRQLRVRLAEGLPLLWQAGGREVRGYEIHCGRVERAASALPAVTVLSRQGAPLQEPEGALAAGGTLAGTLLHGLFEDAGVRAALCAALGVNVAATPATDPYDRLADGVERALDMGLVDRIAQLG